MVLLMGLLPWFPFGEGGVVLFMCCFHSLPISLFSLIALYSLPYLWPWSVIVVRLESRALFSSCIIFVVGIITFAIRNYVDVCFGAGPVGACHCIIIFADIAIFPLG